jgi:hypothetical protein
LLGYVGIPKQSKLNLWRSVWQESLFAFQFPNQNHNFISFFRFSTATPEAV